MRFLILLLLLPVWASAQESDTGARAQKMRELVDALPVEARIELKRMYRRYSEVVARRLEGGWSARVLSEAVIQDVDEPFQPARLVEEMIDQRRREADRLEEALANADDKAEKKKLSRALKVRRREAAALEARDKREKGICRDWSDLVWSEFMSMELEHWGARDERREARPYHTAAVACSPANSPEVCLAFDPWEDGRPNVFAYSAWNESTPGGRFPAQYFLHDLPDKLEVPVAKKAGKKP